jgi:hypothetical protein
MAVRFVAPTGYQHGMKPGVEYTLILNEGPGGRVLLVGFPLAPATGKRRTAGKKAAKKTAKKVRKSQKATPHTRREAHLVKLPHAAFLEGIRPAKPGMTAPLEPVRTVSTVPPWLSFYEGKDMNALPELRELRKVKALTEEEKAQGKEERTPTSPRSDAEDRVARVSVAISQARTILKSGNPDRELSRLARSTEPRTNEQRFRLWFYLLVAYDFNFWAVMPCRLNYGKWDRTEPEYAQSILGADRIHHGGTPRCWSSKEMRAAIPESFKTRAKLGMTMTEVWAIAVRLDFGGRLQTVEVKLPNGRVRRKPAAFHDQGKPLPSPDVYRHHTVKTLGIKFVRETLKGNLTVEMNDEPNVGSQSEHLQYIGQQANFDCRHVAERPRSYLRHDHTKATHLPAMLIVDLVDGATGHIDGIGPGLASEDAEGYKLALFCSAIDKAVYGDIVGIPIAPEQWSSKGLHRDYFADRGPGNSAAVRESVAPWGINAEMARSYTPKDDAMAEAKHPRKKNVLGAPTVVLSDLTVQEILKREILRVDVKNNSDNALPRASDRAVVEGGANTPERLYTELKANYRDSLIQIAFADAVRQFLRSVEFEVLDDGKMRYRGKVYRPMDASEVKRLACNQRGEALVNQPVEASDLTRFVWKHRGEGLKVSGFLYWPATRYMWAVFKGQIIWLEKQSVDDALVRNCSDHELEMIQKARSRASGERQQEKPAVVSHAQQIFQQETGKEWHAGKRVRAPAKVSKEAMEEAQMIKGLR